MKKPEILHLPEKYLERQRIIKALQIEGLYLAMWSVAAAIGGKEGYIWGVYVDDNEKLYMRYFNKDTLKLLGKSSRPPKVEELNRWLREQDSGSTEYIGYAIGSEMRPPPKPEGKIIPFPAPPKMMRANHRKQVKEG